MARTHCRECGDLLIPKYDAGRSRCICCRAAQNLAAWRRRQTARTSIVQLRELHIQAKRAVLGTVEIRAGGDGQADLRRTSRRYEELLRQRGVLSTAVNEPPPGWTPEEDRREEWIALGEMFVR